jgi:hypothetical protein
MVALTGGPMGKQFQDMFTVVGTALSTNDPAAPASGDRVTTTVTVPGAAFGDFCLVAPGLDPGNTFFTAYVTAANTVTIAIGVNAGATAGTNLAAIQARVVVLRLNPNYF